MAGKSKRPGRRRPLGGGYYHCSHCGADVWRDSRKHWIASWCGKWGGYVHITRLK